MNSPKEQATLYRKAAETIEMCTPHGIDPMIKNCGAITSISRLYFDGNYDTYEFPIAVIECRLVWKGTHVYDENGNEIEGDLADRIIKDGLITVDQKKIYYKLSSFTLTPPKQPLCEVEGKPVYKGDKLWFLGNKIILAREITASTMNGDLLITEDGGWLTIDCCSWNPPKRTVMVELLVEDAELYAKYTEYKDLAVACRKALDNLK